MSYGVRMAHDTNTIFGAYNTTVPTYNIMRLHYNTRYNIAHNKVHIRSHDDVKMVYAKWMT